MRRPHRPGEARRASRPSCRESLLVNEPLIVLLPKQGCAVAVGVGVAVVGVPVAVGTGVGVTGDTQLGKWNEPRCVF